MLCFEKARQQPAAERSFASSQTGHIWTRHVVHRAPNTHIRQYKEHYSIVRSLVEQNISENFLMNVLIFSWRRNSSLGKTPGSALGFRSTRRSGSYPSNFTTTAVVLFPSIFFAQIPLREPATASCAHTCADARPSCRRASAPGGKFRLPQETTKGRGQRQ